MIRKFFVNIAKQNLALQRQQSLGIMKRMNEFSTAKDEKSGKSQTQISQQQLKRERLNKQMNQSDSQYKQQEEYKPQEQNRNTVGWWIWRTLVWGSIGIFSYNVYLVSIQTKQRPAQLQTGAIPGYIDAAKMAYRSYEDIMEFFTQPPVKKLLPDILHPSIQPKTLVFNLTGTLIDTDFVLGKGMTLKRRPGLNQFLNKLSQLYEIIIFSDDQYMFISSTVPYLDPRQMIIVGAFGRQCMVWHKGRYIKDLKYLNRDPRHIIVVDKDIQNVKKHPNNTIVLKEFHGQQTDDQLIKLLPLLENLANPQIKDVRKVLEMLGQNPHDKFYQQIKDRQEKIQAKQKSGLFGIFSGSQKK